MRTILGRTSAAVLTVGTAPVRLDGTILDTFGGRKSVLIGNGAADVYLGDQDVTTATGFRLAAGAQLGLDATRGAVWAVAAANTTLGILEGF